MMKIKNSDKEEMQRLCDFVRRIWKPLERFHKIVATCLMKATVKML